MKITKEILELFQIKSVILIGSDMEKMTFLKRIEGNEWFVSIPEDHSFNVNDIIKMQINFYDQSQKIRVRITESGKRYCVIDIPKNQTGRIERLLKLIDTISYRDEKYGRRKEERVKVGKKNFQKFGLISPEQTLFVNKTTISQPFVIVDASIHGIKIITPFYMQIRDITDFNLKLTFANPIQTIILNAHKVYTHLERVNEKVYATFSCQLLEPIHYAWKQRVINLIETIE